MSGAGDLTHFVEANARYPASSAAMEMLAERRLEELLPRIRRRLSDDLGVSESEVVRQVGLHLPRFLDGFDDDRALEAIIDVTSRVLRNHADDERNMRELAGLTALGWNHAYVVKGEGTPSLVDSTTGYVPLRFGPVDRSVGEVIEARLHYLRAPRHDAPFRFGLFLPGAAAPMAYLSISRLDRLYALRYLRSILRDDLRSDEVCHVARAYCCAPGLQNASSMLVRLAGEAMLHEGYRLMTTTVAPSLGFSGASVLASGFVPVGLVPMTYQYGSDGRYVTRRSHAGAHHVSFGTNVLTVRGLDRRHRRLARRSGAPRQVDAIEHAAAVIDPTEVSVVTRDRLACLKGSYLHNLDNQSPSGSPGTSETASSAIRDHLLLRLHSVWLEAGYCVRLCRGTLTHRDGSTPRRDHGWLCVGSRSAEVAPVLVDIFADPILLGPLVAHGTRLQLEADGLRYEEAAT